MSRSAPSTSDATDRPGRAFARRIGRVLPPLLLLAGVAAFVVVRPDGGFGFERLLQHRTTLRAFVAQHGAGALALYAALYVLCASLAIPGGLVLTLAGGLLFGTIVGGLTAACSATAGGTLLFLITRTFLRARPARGRAGRVSGLIERLRQGFRRGGWPFMLFLRLSPWMPFWLVTVAAASGGIPRRTFIWTTVLGILPITFIVAGAGDNFDRIVAASGATLDACRLHGETECKPTLPLGEIFSAGSIALLVAGSLLALAPTLLGALRRRRAEPLQRGASSMTAAPSQAATEGRARDRPLR